MLTVVMTSMPASSSSSTSCQRFSWRLPGTLVWASSSTRATVGPPGEDGVEVHLLEGRRRGSRSGSRGTTSRSRSWACGRRAGRGSRRSRRPRRCRARGGASPRRAWRRSCPRRGRRRGRSAADPYGPWLPGSSPPMRSPAVEGEVELEHVDARFAEEAELAAVGVVVDGGQHVVDAAGRGRSATRAACSRALATEMSGSRPEPEAVTASTGTSWRGRQAVLLAVGGDPVGDGWRGGRGWWARGWTPRWPRRRSRCRRPTGGDGSTWRR